MLSEQVQNRVNKELKKYPANQKQSAVMAALRFVQDEKGWISNDDIEDVAEYLGMAKMAVYEVATFYHMYHLKPVGKHVITVCTNLSCTLCGALDRVAYIEKKLGVALGETTSDGKYTLLEGECMGACKDAPMLTINNKKICSFMSEDKIDQMLTELDKS